MAKTPVRLRPAVGKSIGTTAFFRNRILFKTLLDELAQRGQKRYSILVHACSIGAEVYSLIIQYLMKGHQDRYSLRVRATDIEGSFIDYAREACYPRAIVDGMSNAERAYVEIDNDVARVHRDVAERVEFIAPTDFTTYASPEPVDVVLLLNCLVYVPQEQQSAALAQIAAYNTEYLLVTAFHRASIKDDLERNGYQPILTNQREIHESWTDRRVDAVFTPGNGIYADWSLPAFSKCEDYEYLYCSLFRKSS